MFILICNLAIWLNLTFELGESYDSILLREYYGPLAWTVILYMLTPLAVFFRFHSAVCLSDLWDGVYTSEVESIKQVYKVENPAITYKSSATPSQPGQSRHNGYYDNNSFSSFTEIDRDQSKTETSTDL